MREKLILTAMKYVGYLEKKSGNMLENFTANAGYNNYTQFAVTYKMLTRENYQGQPWCAMFVSSVFAECFGEEKGKKLLNGYFAYCPAGVKNFKNTGRFSKSNPEKGDVIFFKDNSGVACHVGIVCNVDSGYVYTIEGNTSVAAGVVANGGAVAKKKYLKSYNKILGYGKPKYESEGKKMEEKKVEKVEKVYNWTTACPEWSQGYVHKALEMGIIKGDEKGNLNLTDEKIWCLVVVLRATGVME